MKRTKEAATTKKRVPKTRVLNYWDCEGNRRGTIKVWDDLGNCLSFWRLGKETAKKSYKRWMKCVEHTDIRSVRLVVA